MYDTQDMGDIGLLVFFFGRVAIFRVFNIFSSHITLETYG